MAETTGPPAGQPDAASDDRAGAPPGWRAEGRVALALIGVSAAIGLFVGVAWWLIAPRPDYLVGDAGAAALVPATEGAFIAADGVLAVLGLVVGAVLGAVAASRRPDAGPGVVLGVGLGGLLGSAVGAALGMLLGRADVGAAAATAAVGTVVPGPLQVTAPGVVLTWPIAGVIAVLAVVASRTGRGAGDGDG